VKITEKEVRYVAALANLNLTDAEIPKLQADLSEILEHIAQLNEVPTDGVEPMAQVTYPGSENASFRADEVHKNLTQEQSLANAPEQGAGSFKVPSVIEREE